LVKSEKQTQNKAKTRPILSAVGGLPKMNLKSLAGKSGHTRTDSYRKFRWTIPARFWIIA